MGLAYAATGVSRSATSLYRKSVNALFCFNVRMIELYEGKGLQCAFDCYSGMSIV